MDEDNKNGMKVSVLFILMIGGLACWAFGGLIYVIIVNSGV